MKFLSNIFILFVIFLNYKNLLALKVTFDVTNQELRVVCRQSSHTISLGNISHLRGRKLIKIDNCTHSIYIPVIKYCFDCDNFFLKYKGCPCESNTIKSTEEDLDYDCNCDEESCCSDCSDEGDGTGPDWFSRGYEGKSCFIKFDQENEILN